MAKKVYIMENLCCANCAAKIEHEVSELVGVNSAVLVYATKQLRVDASNPDGLLDTIQDIAKTYESDIVVYDRDGAAGTNHRHHHHHNEEHEHHHEHGDECGCGCDHDHEHHHEHGDECGCGHDHDHEHHHEHGDECGCGCDHDHKHHHEHDDECGCGCDHDHKHHHEHDDKCGCGHDHEHEQHHHEEHTPVHRGTGHKKPGKLTQKVYIMENLGCANCAAKIEKEVGDLDEVGSATMVFATKQLRVTTTDPDGLRDVIQKIANSHEPDVIVRDHAPEKKGTAQQKKNDKNRRLLARLGCGAVLFVIGLILQHMNLPFWAAPAVLIADFLLLGWDVLAEAGHNLTTGHVFDENFLMSIATIGAVCIGSYEEAVGVMLFFQIGEAFEKYAVDRSREQIMDAVDLRPETVNLEEDGAVHVIPAVEAEVGDILIIRVGDRVPVDGEVVSGESYLDTSAVTGEPVPVRVEPGDAITSGCVNTSGVLRMRATKPLSESMMTRILDSVENAAASKPRIDRFITRFARVYTPVVVAIAAATAIIPSLATGNWSDWVYTALTFLVISCPCALVLSVPLAFFAGIGSASQQNILFKGGVSLEALNRVKAVVMDKTGTITKGEFVVSHAEPASGTEERELLRLAAACEQASTHPIAVSILSAAQQRGIDAVRPDSIEEIAGRGIRAEIDSHVVLCGSHAFLREQGVTGAPEPTADGSTIVELAREGAYIGRICISDTVKEDAQTAIAALRRQKLTTVMLTGDGEFSAQAVANQTGIDEVHAHLLPQDKLSRLGDIRKKHGGVLFVGDGINDAPVLAGADVGAAMGSGADAAIEAADVVYLTGELSAIPESIRLAKRVNRVAMENVVFALVIKIAVMLLGITGILSSMWLAVFADTGVAMLCVLNSVRILYHRRRK